MKMFAGKTRLEFPKAAFRLAFPAVVALWGGIATAEDSDSAAELAKKLNNPIAALISVPFQLNYDQDIGPDDEGERMVLNIQPVVPMTLNEDWNLISRTILPLIRQTDIPSDTDETGMGDIFQNLFFSPKAPTAGGWIWGVGPALLLPTATDELLGAKKWAAGPTAVALKQQHGWTVGALVNHIWSFDGEKDRKDINASFFQPFFAYTTRKYTTFTLNTESSYDWEGEQWSVPINIQATQLFKIAGQPMSLQVGARYWADAPDGGPEGWGLRFSYTLVFPK